MLDLYDFQREIVHNGVLESSKFFVRIDPTETLPPAGDVQLLRALSLRAINAKFPGIHMMTKDDISRYGYGPIEKAPYNAQFSDSGLSFIVDVRGKVYSFWYKWLKYIVACDSSESMFSDAGPLDAVGPVDVGAISPYEVAYKDNYVADITISPTSQLHNKSMDCILFKAFPIAIQEIELDASAQNSPVLLHVTLAYRDHKIINNSEKSGNVFVER